MNPGLGMPQAGLTTEQLAQFIGNLTERLNLVFKNIDGLNIVDIKFELQGGAYIQLNRKGFEIFDGTGRTFFVGIDGKATLTGVKVQTKEGTYPNITLDAEGDLLRASQNENNFIAIDPDLTGTPTQVFKSPLVEALLSSVMSNFSIITLVGGIALNAQSSNLSLRAGNNIVINCSNLTINGDVGWSGTYNDGTNTIIVTNGIITSVI